MGELAQAYIREKWAAAPNGERIAEIRAQLDATLKDRIDALGFDGERLLRVGANDVLQELEALEREAAEEDARAAKAAASFRAAEVRAMDNGHYGGAKAGSAAPARHDRRSKRPGRKRGRARPRA